MTNVFCLDLDVDWTEGLEQPGELLWNGDGWSLMDSLVTTDTQIVSGLDSQGCLIRTREFDLQQFAEFGKYGSATASAQRFHSASLVVADLHAA